MSEHTPGPWVTHPSGKGVLIQDGGPGPDFTLATVTKRPNAQVASIDEMIANARLIAAAPDLLAACRRGLALAEQCKDYEKRLRHICATAHTWKHGEAEAYCGNVLADHRHGDWTNDGAAAICAAITKAEGAAAS